MIVSELHAHKIFNLAFLRQASKETWDLISYPAVRDTLRTLFVSPAQPLRSTFLNYENAQAYFLELLGRSNVTRPEKKVLDIIIQQFSSRMLTCSTPKHAEDLYYVAQLVPGNSTKAHIVGMTGITIYGPLGDSFPASIMSAVDKSGVPSIIKILEKHEASVIETLDLIAPHPHLVSGQIIDIDLAHIHPTAAKTKFLAFLMPKYSGVLEAMTNLTNDVLLRGLKQMVSAVEYIHSHKYVHMDIKGHNIFVDMQGNWYLGDFDSCVHVSEAIRSYTGLYYHKQLRIGVEQPQFDYDWYMLVVTIAIAVVGIEWENKLMSKQGIVSNEKLLDVISHMEHAELKYTCLLLLERHD